MDMVSRKGFDGVTHPLGLPNRRARLAFFACLAFAFFACGEGPPPAPAPVEVVVAPVVQRDVAVTSEWIGTTEGAVDAEIRAQVSGYLVAREYEEGTIVREGEVLFRIDPRISQAALEQARGDVGRAEAMLGKANLDVERFTPLVAEGAVSRQELDNAIQLQRSAQAQLQMARAAREKTEIDLAFTEIRSPTDGIAGVAAAQLGDLVGPGDPQPLTRVSKVDPIRVSFPISEREYLRFANIFRGAVRGRGATREGGLELILADGSVWPHRGSGVPASAGVDPATGTMLVRGEFPNPDYVLRPGQYARVRAVTETKAAALLVPQRAIAETQGVFQVAVVGPDDKVELRVVEPGVRDGGMQVIVKGLSAGERVVVEGIQKVRSGSVVKPKPAAPAAPAGDGR
jgi:membrane fusion protein, multidrug efflux system